MALGATSASARPASRRGEGMGARVRARVTASNATRTVRAAPLRVVAEDFPKPDNINKTDNYKQGEELSNKFKVSLRAGGVEHAGCSVGRVVVSPRDAWRLCVLYPSTSPEQNFAISAKSVHGHTGADARDFAIDGCRRSLSS